MCFNLEYNGTRGHLTFTWRAAAAPEHSGIWPPPGRAEHAPGEELPLNPGLLGRRVAPGGPASHEQRGREEVD